MKDHLEATIYATSDCNFNCNHCYFKQGNMVQGELQKQDIDYIADNYNLDKTVLLGGEPLLWGQLEHALQKLPKVTISTNGALLSKKLDLLEKYSIKELKENEKNPGLFAIQLSIDGFEKSHELIRGQDSWKIILDSIKLLKENNIRFYLRCSYYDDNISDMPKVIREVGEKYDVPITFFPRTDRPPLTVQDQIRLYNTVMKAETKETMVIQPNFFVYIGEKGRCPAGDYRLNFSHDKRITPCNMNFDFELGKIGDDPELIRENADYWVKTMKTPYRGCLRCPHVGTCKSGCLVAKTYVNCPLRKNTTFNQFIPGLKMNTAMVNIKIEGMRGLLRNIVTC